MSVCPLQNRTNPSVVPGPSTEISTPELEPWKFSATNEVIGSTVDEPEMLREPETSPPPEAPLVLELLLHATATSAIVSASATAPASFRIFDIDLLPPSVSGFRDSRLGTSHGTAGSHR